MRNQDGTVIIREAANAAERAAALALRLQVFCDEQGVERAQEIDAHDATAQHVVVLERGRVIGTLRWRMLADAPWAKIERVAVAREARGRGVGAQLLRHVLDRLDGLPGIAASVVHAQTHATGFYERLGYQAEGAPFDEDGIRHVRMRRPRGGRPAM
jgi:ElaA protein